MKTGMIEGFYGHKEIWRKEYQSGYEKARSSTEQYLGDEDGYFSPFIKMMKALALGNIGRLDEAFSLIESARAEIARTGHKEN